ncbi:hypothetical protein F5Y01DRAFT_326635 [Xylaria sp. FL0043]|nr:hypothetical protein F5Y01DRAFT_326635 [Xylaria sp. FL0043]
MTSQNTEPIAIIGSACRFPGGVDSPSALWELLKSPRDVCSEIPPDRFDTRGYYHPNAHHHGTTNVRHSYLLPSENLLAFDAAFFNISPNEAESMDPQQRLLLETVYEALDSGGHTIDSLRGSDTAVYTGTMGVDYNDTGVRDLNTVPQYFATGVNRAIISNRVSYFFDWHGPSMTIDTACSSSLVAVHQGVQALRTYQSRVALACGTQVILNPEMYIIESKLTMLSPTGRSRMWDADADGYARGEGVAAVVLKRLSDAIADGDHIECLIRETGSNQDGHSNGITVPSAAAQTALIRQTYAKAGLDPENSPWDRPQFFEAHGTGTKAGDPKEAAAIYECFGKQNHSSSGETHLYVGSIKTVVGHLEGSAGLAGLLKGSVSLQQGFIPPNLLFNRLNPDIEPFYKGLCVPTQLTPWPALPEGVPRRVSVNSFGFGGSNAHAILEQYRPSLSQMKEASALQDLAVTPFVFSAASESSLISVLRAYSEYLKNHDQTNPSDLAWTLQSRKSQFPFRVAFSALTIEQLRSKIDERLATISQSAGSTLGIRTVSKPNNMNPRILGVFTGQGAQWATMGSGLIRASAFVRERLQELDESLSALPAPDRPKWRLQDEILAGQDVSRIGEAALSQPLCTAIQIVLVDLLQKAGLTFAAVVGHSSGEIAAAYAAGFLSARDAIRVAYYRGLHAKLAGNAETGQKGAMLAVGTSWEDAEEIVSLKAFKRRVAIAAHNSSASLTLSGDLDAVERAQKMFAEEKKFARLLKVDTAYHSHHMLPCGDPYVASLRQCGVQVSESYKEKTCAWFSSVVPNEKPMNFTERLKDEYWRDNMTNAVLFAEAIRNAVAGGDNITLALEVGPHPALKGPATQSIADVQSAAVPYSGLLSRGTSDVEAVSDALGFVWTHTMAGDVDFKSYAGVVSAKQREPRLVCGLPLYSWNHERVYWNESRRSRKLRTRAKAPHELLGALSPESTSLDLRWSNVLKVSEIPWLDGHQLQGQTVFPTTGYVSMAFEAARYLSVGKPVKAFELTDLSIPRAITFDEGDHFGVETLVTLTDIRHHRDQTTTGQFSCYSLPVIGSGSEQEMDLVAQASLKVIFGAPGLDTLSCSMAEDYNMSTVDAERFYSTLDKLGYGYSGPFRTISGMRRKLGTALAEIGWQHVDPSSYLIHPSTLDVALQASMLAYSAPGDERLWSLHVPTSIQCIRVNPAVCALQPAQASTVPVCATISDDSASFSACIDLFGGGGKHGMVQIEDLVIKTFAPATEADDRVMFAHTMYDYAVPDGAAVTEGVRATPSESELAVACERIAYYYIRKWDSDLLDEEWAKGQPHHKHLRNWVEHVLSIASAGKHPTLKKEWCDDSHRDIKALMSRYPDNLDVKMLYTVGENLPAAVRGDTTMLEHLLKDNMLDDFYKLGSGFQRYNWFLAAMVKQIAHRYPHMKILEIGAGTGGATKAVLEEIGNSMSAYTYTDISIGFFNQAAELFKAYNDKMNFKLFDVERTPASQGYNEHSYDIVIASNVLHATKSLHTTLVNTRKLLRPGGYLLLLEITNNEPVRTGFVWGTLAGWWLGVDDGRKWAPTISPTMWHSALRKAGFAGVDAVTPPIDGIAWPFSIMASQAVDDRVQFLRRPLSSPSVPVHIDSLVVMGNGSLESGYIAEELADILGRFCSELTILNGFPTDAEALDLSPMSSFINLTDLEVPFFKDPTTDKLEGLKRVFGLAQNVLWITRDARIEQPYQMASISFSRSVRRELGHVSLNHLDITNVEQHNIPKLIAEHFLQLYILEEWKTSQDGDGKQSQLPLLWSIEPEAYLDKGRLMLPRLIENDAQNARLNSLRRHVSKKLPVLNRNISVLPPHDGGPPSLVEKVTLNMPITSSDTSMRVESTSLMALRVLPDTYFFLAAGTDLATGSYIVGLSAENSREIFPVASALVSTHNQVGHAALLMDDLLVAVASELLADSILQDLLTDSILLIHCSSRDRALTSAISRRATFYAVRVLFLYDFEDQKFKHQDSLHISSSSSKHAVRKAIHLAAPSHFLDLTRGQSGFHRSDLSVRVARLLPPTCKIIDTSSLVQYQSSSSSSMNDDILVSQLKNAVARVDVTEALSLNEAQNLGLVIQLGTISDLKDAPSHTTSTVHWPSEGLVDVQVQPLDARGFFSKNKTYLLVGLTGAIGQSLTEWMVSNGAGCVCLTSRRPNLDARWIKSFEGTGADVKVFSMDVTDKRAVEVVVNDIKLNCPPIAGVANGAMVLDDSLFSKMPANKMQDVLRPKIDGSNHLDELFFHEKLDFFIPFSSASCIVGNVGQSNYAAANGYISSLVRQRRRRGLAASSFDIGVVAGIGYIETAGQVVWDQLATLGLRPLSETDLRQAFAETILLGHPDAQDASDIPNAVVTTGIRHFAEDEDIKGPWFTNPFFSHCVIEAKTSELVSEDQGKKTAFSASRQLLKAKDAKQALQVLQDCLAAKLRVMLQLGDQDIDYDVPLIALGIDSLVSVEVRSWFLKEINVDMPVLKIAGGASLSELCRKALEKLPAKFLTGFAASEEPAKCAVENSEPPAPSEPPHSSDTKYDAISEGISSSGESPALSALSTPPTALSEMTPRSDSLLKSSEDAEIAAPDSTSYFPRFQQGSESPSVTEPGKPDVVARRFLKSIPVSFAQSRFWFLHQLLPDKRTHNVSYYYHITGDLNTGDLERAVRAVTSRHESLRTCFVQDDADAALAYQKVLPSSPTRLVCKHVRSMEDVASEYKIFRETDLDLASGELLRLVLLTLSPSSHYLLVCHHHIIMDGLSLQVFLADLEKAYKGESLGPPPRQYPDFSKTQEIAFHGGEMKKHLAYWRSIFPPLETPPTLPLLPMARSSSRVVMTSFDTHQVHLRLGLSLASRIRSVSKAQRSTPFHLYLATFKAMLFAFTKTDELTIGIADGARNDSDVMNSIGLFLNLLTLRFRRKSTQSFLEAVSEARQVAFNALEHSRLPFDILLTELGVGRSSTHSPFFQAFLDYRQGMKEKQPFGNCEMEMQEEVHTGKTAYDITVDVTDTDDDAVIMVRAQKSLYDFTATKLLCETYVHFLDTLTNDPSSTLGSVRLFSEKALVAAAEIGRGPNLVSDWPETLPHRIDQIALLHRDQTALVDGFGKKLTYSAMIDRIGAIAEALVMVGVGNALRVLVYQEASSDWPCSMLAIMRTGATYVPLDLRNPMPRLAAIAKDCEPAAVLVDHTTAGTVEQLGVPYAYVINVSDLDPKENGRMANHAKAEAVAAILYTSGSTGTPKGIVVTHAGLRNEVEGYTKMWGLGAERVLQQSAFTFNHSSDQIYTGLVNGGMVYVVPGDKRGDPLEITNIVRQHNLTYTKATPSEYSLWMQFGGGHLRQATEWRFAFGGGEPLTSNVVKEFANLELPHLRLFNSYGPTEISISSTKMEIEYRDPSAQAELTRIPCGYSLPNYYMYVVDSDLRPVPAGMPGELCIGGTGVSLGYLNNDSLTRQHFISNPFASKEDIARGWARLYRTGDIGHLREDGAMVFHGRMEGDTQVKIRGLRIELSDIESNIVSASNGALREAVVTLRGDNPGMLAAHVVFALKSTIADRTVFLEDLLDRLPIPQYMKPVVAVPLTEFPLTNHSKVDRKAIQALPLPARTTSKAPDELILTETMIQLKILWEDVLGRQIADLGFQITPKTSFFNIGGNSLLIIRLQDRIRKTFKITLPLVDLLGANTLGEMAHKIEKAPTISLIDWESETALPKIPSFLDDLSAGQSSDNTTKGKTIVVTGATGFLSNYVLPLLTTRKDVDKIHCIAVRSTEKVYSNPKIITHNGDLSMALLGLPEGVFRELAEQADAIIHMGAARSFWDNYHVLRPSNVNPTKELVKMAAPRQVAIHYFSTGRVARGAIIGTDEAQSAALTHPSIEGTDGYTATRWASERILERAGVEIGIPSSIYRFSPTSKPAAPSQDVLDELSRFVDLTGCRPDLTGWAGRLDMISAAQVAQSLCISVMAGPAGPGASYSHIWSSFAVSDQDLLRCVGQHRDDSDNELDRIPLLAWIGRIKKLGFGFLLTSHEATLEKSWDGQVSTKLELLR